MVDYQYLGGVFALLVLALLALVALTGGMRGPTGATSTMMKRAIASILTTLLTRIFLYDSGLGHSDITLWSISIGAGLAVALIYHG